MAGDADEARESGLACLDRGREGAVGTEGGLPIRRIDEVVQLDQVDMIGAEAAQRLADLIPSAPIGALPRLRGEKEPVPTGATEPRCDPELGVAVAGRGVQVGESVPIDQGARAIGIALGRLRQGGAAENRPRAEVPGTAEPRPLDHLPTIDVTRARGSMARATAGSR